METSTYFTMSIDVEHATKSGEFSLESDVYVEARLYVEPEDRDYPGYTAVEIDLVEWASDSGILSEYGVITKGQDLTKWFETHDAYSKIEAEVIEQLR